MDVNGGLEGMVWGEERGEGGDASEETTERVIALGSYSIVALRGSDMDNLGKQAEEYKL